MDPASCIITIVETAFSIAQYIKTVYEGRQERQQLNREILAVYRVLSALQDQFASDGWAADTAWAGPIRPLLAPGGTIDLLRDTLESITKRLTVPGQERTKRLIRALKWPFDKDENKRLTDRVSSLMQIVNIAYSQANLELDRDTNSGVTHVKKIIDAQTFNNTLEWISVLDYKALQESDEKRPVKGTGRWFLESPPYRNWVQGSLPVIWCHGIPGAGKTLLASAAYDHLRDVLKAENTLLLIVFCQFDEKRSYLALAVLSAMLRQAVRAQPALSDTIQKMYADHTSGQNKVRPSMDQICEALKAELSRFKKVFVILDGLDEMPEQTERSQLLRKLESLEPRPYLMVTSRPLPEIKDWFTTQADPLGFHIDEDDVDDEDLSQYRYCDDCYDVRRTRSDAAYMCTGCDRDYCMACLANIESCLRCGDIKDTFQCTLSRAVAVAANPADLERYIDWRIDTSPKLKHNIARSGNRDLRQEIVNRVLADAEDMFLIAKFHMNVLADQITVKHVVEALKKLPREIDGAYERMFQRIDRTEIKETLRLFLSVIVSARTLLTTAALGHAVAMADAPTDREELEESIPEMRSLVSLHDTDRHAIIARLCLDYLQSGVFADGPCAGSDPYQALEARKHEYSFLSYAALNWGYHVNEAKNPEISRLALQFLSLQSNIEAIVQLLANGAHVDARDCLGTTPLMYAAAAGHSQIVKILLQSGAEPAAICNRGATALHRACENVQTEVVRRLVELPEDIAVNAFDERYEGRSALIWTIKATPEILRLLLTRKDLLVNGPMYNTQKTTALYRAASWGHAETVEMLLKHPDIEVNALTKSRDTALFAAVRYGHHEILELLLRYGADPEIQDRDGGTVLLRAIDSGSLACVRALVDRHPIHSAVRFLGVEELRTYLDDLGPDEEASVDLLDNDMQQTPLHIATRAGKLEAVNWLLDHGAQLHIRDMFGWTPLHLAAGKGWDEIATILLDRGADVNALDLCERTPLILATAQYSNPKVAFVLVQRGATFDKHAIGSQQVLIWACESGELDVAKRLLDAGVPFQKKDGGGLTPYQRAKHAGHEELAAFLSERIQEHLRPRSPLTSRDHVPTLQDILNDSATEAQDVAANGDREEPISLEVACKDSNKPQNLDTEIDTTAGASPELVTDDKDRVGDGIDVNEAEPSAAIAASSIVSKPLRMDKGADTATKHGRSSTLGITTRRHYDLYVPLSQGVALFAVSLLPKAFQGSFLESRTGIMHISDFSAEHFGIFADRVATGKLEAQSLALVIELYVMADMLDVPAFRAAIADNLTFDCFKADFDVPDVSLITYMMQNIPKLLPVHALLANTVASVLYHEPDGLEYLPYGFAIRVNDILDKSYGLCDKCYFNDDDPDNKTITDQCEHFFDQPSDHDPRRHHQA
ncbi:hypothetical protein KCU61_g2031, partial [Aureobasidium melanogenum]